MQMQYDIFNMNNKASPMRFYISIQDKFYFSNDPIHFESF